MDSIPDWIAQLIAICGKDFVFTEPEILQQYGQDETEDLCFPPQCVVKPANAEEISRILKLCNQYKIPLTPVGARTGLSGGALSVHQGIALSTERLNRILHIDEKNLQVMVEPAVINQVLQEAVLEKGLFYPPDPSSRGSCFIGGNIAENSGGARAVKYGVTKDYVLNLEVVLPDGSIIWTGANTLKNATGYNLTQLMIGSEGTLGIITKAVLRLLPAPQHQILLLVSFPSAEKACEAVSAVFRAGLTPSALEFMERDAIDWALKYVPDVHIAIDHDVQALLLIELDGQHEMALVEEAEMIAEVVRGFECGNMLYAHDHQQKETLWQLRRCIGHAVKTNSIYKEEDTVVPRYELPGLLKVVKETGRKYGFQSVCYGHAGDGNLHVNIIKGKLSDAEWEHEVPKGIREIFEFVVAKKGTISGEHGIGYVQRNYMPIAFDRTQMALMKGIKALFDPNNILNPGKIFPD